MRRASSRLAGLRCVYLRRRGLGVRRLGDWNRASLLRLFWEMARGSNALWAQLLRQKYLKNQSIWEVEVNPTFLLGF